MSSFDTSGKVAIVTGGASGLGLVFATELLAKGARGVTLADINSEVGYNIVHDLESKFGKNKAIFVKTDVTDYEQFEGAFMKTVSVFNHVDILINNAGICNGALWRKELEINVNGTVNGILLGLEKYLPKYKSGSEGLIVNISSIAGTAPFGSIPTYTGSKFAVHGMTISWGLPSHFDRTKVRVVGICPGVTETELLNNIAERGLGPFYGKLLDKEFGVIPSQSTAQIAPHLIKVIEKAPSGTIWILEGGEAPYQYQMPDRFKIPKVYLD